MTYLESIFMETLRLYPSAWLIGREAVRDTRIGDERIARGTTLLVSPWVLHRDPRFHEDPSAFRPERWSDGLASRLPRFAYVPFGGGQRVCIGSSFAQMEAMLVLATIAQRFRWSLDPHVPSVEPLPVVTLRPRQLVPMLLSGR